MNKTFKELKLNLCQCSGKCCDDPNFIVSNMNVQQKIFVKNVLFPNVVIAENHVHVIYKMYAPIA